MKALATKHNDVRAQAFVIAVIAAAFACRAIGLDRDLAPWGIASYQPIDEGSYSILALNLINYGTIDAAKAPGDMPGVTPPHVRVNLLGNALSYASMKTIGKNYTGARLPSVLWATGTALLAVVAVARRARDEGWGDSGTRWLAIAALGIMTLDFSHLAASRAVEPSVVRGFMNGLILVIAVTLRGRDRLRQFLIGFLAAVSIFWVYVSNLFILIPCATLVLVPTLEQRWRTTRERALFMGLGLATAMAIIEPYYLLVWRTSAVGNLISAVSSFQGVVGYTNFSRFRGVLKNAVAFWSANAFLYNPVLLCLNLAGVAYGIRAIIRRRDESATFSIAAILGFFLQTIYSNDYIVRKMEAIFPLLVFSAAIGAIGILGAIAKRFENPIQSRKSAFGSWVLAGICGCWLAAISAYRLILLSDGTSEDFAAADRIMVFVGQGFALSAAFILAHATTKTARVGRRRVVQAGILCLCATIASSGYFAAKYVYAVDTRSEKAIMIELGRLAGGRAVLGEYENGFSLYNDIKPVLQSAEVVRRYATTGKAELYFDYDFEEPFLSEYMEDVFGRCAVSITKIRTFPREFQTFGEKRKVTLYQLRKK